MSQELTGFIKFIEMQLCYNSLYTKQEILAHVEKARYEYRKACENPELLEK